MKNIFKAILILSLAIPGWAQDGETVHYNIKKDDPKDINNLSISLDPVMMDMSGWNLAMGFGARADYMMNSVLDFSAEYQKAYYFDMAKYDIGDPSGASVGPNSVNSFSDLQVCGRLHFVDKVSETYHTMVLSQSSYTSGDYVYTNSKTLSVPGKTRKIKALEGGLYYLRTPFSFDGVLSDVEPSHFMLENKLSGVESVGPDGGTMMTVPTFFGGISWQSISNLKILTDKYGVKYSSGWTNVYVDLLFAPVVNFSDVSDGSGEEYKVSEGQSLEGNSVIGNLGWRLGMAIRQTQGTTLSYSFNIGSRPGYKGEGGFINPKAFMEFSFGITFSQKAKLF